MLSSSYLSYLKCCPAKDILSSCLYFIIKKNHLIKFLEKLFTLIQLNIHRNWNFTFFFHFLFSCIFYQQARVYLLSAGFSLAFGSMFAKTYRVHRIFTRTGSVFKDKMLQDIQLILLVCALLLVDGLVVTLWVVADPMERHLHNLTLEISSIDRSVVYQPQVSIQ